MLTNLHQPRTSHLVLVAAFAGTELVTRAYRELIHVRYSFNLFEDNMLVI
jgi:S-adenosylmethionine:tRNA ribosyltransferase-isomerase